MKDDAEMVIGFVATLALLIAGVVLVVSLCVEEAKARACGVCEGRNVAATCGEYVCTRGGWE